jgi:hypothetical protein
MLRSICVRSTALAFALAFGANAQAGLIEVNINKDTHENGNNDCSGFFGSSFGSCAVNGSPVIFKYDPKDGNSINAIFPTVDGDEFGVADSATGTWNYTAGTGDPSVRYWVAKAGAGFNLFYVVPDGALDTTCNASASAGLSAECLNAAQVTTSGNWATPDGKGLSHLTFYDTGGDREPPPTGVPAPAALGLFALALGLVGLRRRTA